MDLNSINLTLKDASPQDIVRWALSLNKKAIVTTNFRPFEACILHAVSNQSAEIPIIWCDTGYNTRKTYEHALRTIQALKLNVDLFVPQQSSAYRDVVLGIPEIDTPEHDLFTYQVKLEPFERAMEKHQPEVWFTNLRKNQTDFRSSIDIVSLSKSGIIKVSPFFHWSDEAMRHYIEEFQLESEDNYFDPTKVLSNRECGLHN